jgi:hypothetical protein
MHATMFIRGRETSSSIRRGVKAAPQILVLMVQVRSLAAELLAGRRVAVQYVKVDQPRGW